jgi:hypothetical protein
MIFPLVFCEPLPEGGVYNQQVRSSLVILTDFPSPNQHFGCSLVEGPMFDSVCMDYWLVVSNMNGLFPISYMGCHPTTIDELHHFSRWFF